MISGRSQWYVVQTQANAETKAAARLTFQYRCYALKEPAKS